MGYLPALDGWRGASILLVLLSHAGLDARIPGGLGVTVFFFVSGLLITGQLVDERRRHGRIDLRRFYWRRILRLLPASTAFIVLAGLAFLALGGAMRPGAWLAALFYLANYAQLTTHLFDTNLPGLPHPFVILWSLAIEEQFYLVWPPLIILGAATRRGGVLAAALGCCLVFCLAWRMHLAPLCGGPHDLACGPHGDDWIAKSTDTRADSLAFGALAAVMLRSRLSAVIAAGLRSPVLLAGAAGLLILTVVLRNDAFRDTWRYTLQGVSLLVLVPASTLPENALARLFSQPWLMAVGRLSYGLYLWHWLVLMLAGRVAPNGLRFTVCFTVLTVLLTLASWRLIERPSIALRRRAGSNASATIVPGRAATPFRTDPAIAG